MGAGITIRSRGRINKTEIFQKTGNVPGFNVCLQCLNKCCFITAAVSAGFVEMQGLWILRSCYQHYLVAIAAYGELFCVGKTEPGISSVPILPVCNNILDKCKRTYISCQVGNDQTVAGGYDFSIFFINNHMVIRVVQDLIPGIPQMIVIIRDPCLMKMQIQFQQSVDKIDRQKNDQKPGRSAELRSILHDQDLQKFTDTVSKTLQAVQALRDRSPMLSTLQKNSKTSLENMQEISRGQLWIWLSTGEQIKQ